MNPNLIAIIINNEEHPLNRQHLMEISPVIKKYVDDNPYKSDFFRIENTIPKEDIPKFIKLLKYNDTEITHSTIPLIHFLKKELGISIFDEKIDELTKKLNSVFDRDDCILRIYEEYEMMVYQLSFDLLVHEINPENSIFFAKLFYTYGYTYPSMFIQKCLPFILSIDSENENIKLLENIKIFQKKKPFFNKAHSLMEKKKGSEIYPLLDFHQKIEKWIYKKNEAKAKTKFESYDYIMTIKNDDIDTLQSLTSNSSLSLNHNFLKSQNAFFQSFILSLIEVAAYFSSIKCFKFLLSNHVDLRDSLFFFAIAGGNPEIIHLCEQHLSFFDYNLSLEIAIIFHHYELISWLIESKNTQFTLENALLCLKYSTFSTVSNHYVNSSLFNIDEFLLLAINSSLTDLAKWILSLDSIDVNYQSQKFSNPLLSACLTNNVAIVECLLTFESIDVNTKIKVHDQSPLHIACKNNYIEIARLLLNHPKIIRNTRDFGKNRKTPLHMAAESGNLEIVKLLLEYDDVEIDASTYDVIFDFISRNSFIFCSD
ncbi:hypothetical protein TRFO_39332 [Tritrichomonas foetus]|uniref:DUF3447 domain-containing protein n=1 Tax=Tritrichomonas foetus TaxID=1144522 RepID=A0A1J4JB96_9EUKA|nr:hypothetical protein TRFO_39332 [Tritrichomonas foetus]|eukprot:OHS94516.1 hypothetical protein TRFO_39332 [Tritrichomonas foetus]